MYPTVTLDCDIIDQSSNIWYQLPPVPPKFIDLFCDSDYPPISDEEADGDDDAGGAVWSDDHDVDREHKEARIYEDRVPDLEA